MTEAAQTAAAELIQEAQLKKLRLAQQILANDRNLNAMNSQVAQGKKAYRALGGVLENAEAYIKGVSHEYFSEIKSMIDSTGKWAGMLENKAMVRDILYEVFGQDSRNAIAKQVANGYLKTLERMRQRFNRAGGDVGKLDYGYVPQPHDVMRILKAGQDKWVANTMPLLDRTRYVNEDGVLMNDAQLAEFLRAAWDTLS
ncbi:MAG TPA: hypothetical protein VFQ89_09285, partial [Candidatus Binatia bacterium]|nr:hypothetical protein [Candidatus Binatia bacterium]